MITVRKFNIDRILRVCVCARVYVCISKCVCVYKFNPGRILCEYIHNYKS